MTYLLALIAGIAGAVAGYFLGATLGFGVAGALGVSDFEGGRGMLAAFVLGPAGGLAGLILSAWLVIRYRGGHRSFGAVIKRLGLVALGIAVIAAAALGYMYMTQPILNPSGRTPQLAFEIRLPPGTPLNVKRDVQLNTEKNIMPGSFAAETRVDADRPVITGVVDVYFRSRWRLLVLKAEGEPERVFSLKLAASPGHMKEFSAWQHVDFVGDPGPQPPRKATPADAFDIRYRLIWPGRD